MVNSFPTKLSANCIYLLVLQNLFQMIHHFTMSSFLRLFHFLNSIDNLCHLCFVFQIIFIHFLQHLCLSLLQYLLLTYIHFVNYKIMSCLLQAQFNMITVVYLQYSYYKNQCCDYLQLVHLFLLLYRLCSNNSNYRRQNEYQQMND